MRNFLNIRSEIWRRSLYMVWPSTSWKIHYEYLQYFLKTELLLVPKLCLTKTKNLAINIVIPTFPAYYRTTILQWKLMFFHNFQFLSNLNDWTFNKLYYPKEFGLVIILSPPYTLAVIYNFGFSTNIRGIFRALSNFYDGTFCEDCQRLLPVNTFL